MSHRHTIHSVQHRHQQYAARSYRLNIRTTLTVCVIIACSMWLSGCVTTRVEVAVAETLDSADGDGIVLLVRRDNVQTETEDQFIDCVKDRLTAGSDALSLLDENVFMDSLFPYFEPRVAPLKVEALPDLLGKPNVAEQIEQAGVRYIMWLDGSVVSRDAGGSMSCDASVGCFGFAWWENGATYEASIWDVKNLENSGIISTDIIGRSFLPALVVPIPLIATTKTKACDQLAKQLKKQFIEE